MKMFDAFKKRYKHVWCLLSLPFLLVKPGAHMYTLQLFNTHSHTYFYMYFNTSSRSHPPTVWFNVPVSFYFLSLLLLLLSLSLRRKRRGDSIQCFELRRKKKINIWIKMGFCFSVRLKIESSRCYNFYIFVMNFYMFV